MIPVYLLASAVSFPNDWLIRVCRRLITTVLLNYTSRRRRPNRKRVPSAQGHHDNPAAGIDPDPAVFRDVDRVGIKAAVAFIGAAPDVAVGILARPVVGRE